MRSSNSSESPNPRSHPRNGRGAVLDIGANSIKLLVGDVYASVVHPVHEAGVQTRLGRGVYQDGRLQPDAIRATAAAVAEFYRAARGLGATRICGVATSAVRDAANAAELLTAVHAACDSALLIEVISGDTEAQLTFDGAISSLADPLAAVLAVDLGGGSTEFVVGAKGLALAHWSVPLGTVRWHERHSLSNPPSLEERVRCAQDLREFLAAGAGLAVRAKLLELSHPAELLGTGGTASALASVHHGFEVFNRSQLEGLCLRLGDIRALRDLLWRLPLENRKKLPGMPPERADILLHGAAIYEALLTEFGFERLRISTRGMRFALLKRLFPAAD